MALCQALWRRVILRIEDTDQERTSPVFEKNILEDLRWLSLDWDEGPEKGGSLGPYHQIQRLEIYDKYTRELFSAGKVYPCYCTEEELEAERASLLSMRMMPRYMGKCKKLTDKEREALESAAGNPPFVSVWTKGLLNLTISFGER